MDESGEITNALWVWDTHHVTLNAVSKTKCQPTQQLSNSTTCLCHLSFSTNGSLVYLLNSSQVSSIFVDSLPFETDLPKDIEATWVIAERDMSEIKKALTQQVQGMMIYGTRFLFLDKYVKGYFPTVPHTVEY